MTVQYDTEENTLTIMGEVSWEELHRWILTHFNQVEIEQLRIRSMVINYSTTLSKNNSYGTGTK